MIWEERIARNWRVGLMFEGKWVVTVLVLVNHLVCIIEKKGLNSKTGDGGTAVGV